MLLKVLLSYIFYSWSFARVFEDDLTDVWHEKNLLDIGNFKFKNPARFSNFSDGFGVLPDGFKESLHFACTVLCSSFIVPKNVLDQTHKSYTIHL